MVFCVERSSTPPTVELDPLERSTSLFVYIITSRLLLYSCCFKAACTLHFSPCNGSRTTSIPPPSTVLAKYSWTFLAERIDEPGRGQAKFTPQNDTEALGRATVRFGYTHTRTATCSGDHRSGRCHNDWSQDRCYRKMTLYEHRSVRLSPGGREAHVLVCFERKSPLISPWVGVFFSSTAAFPDSGVQQQSRSPLL